MKFFTHDEFDSPDAPGSGIKMNQDFLDLLDRIRGDAAIPFKVNSGFRTKEHNRVAGGKPNSAHLKGLAVDLAAPTNLAKFLIAATAIRKGVQRIGFGKNFIHLDVDLTLPHPRIWVY